MKTTSAWLVTQVFCVIRLVQVATSQHVIKIYENTADISLYNGTDTWTTSSCTLDEIICASNVPSIKTSITTGGNSTFSVMLRTPVDYEEVTAFELTLSAKFTCSGHQSQQLIAKIFVSVENVMDTAPVFRSNKFSASIPENHLINTTVITGIQATDADESDYFYYEVNFSDEQEKMFRYQLHTNAEILDIFLISLLDFELQHVYRFTITVIDSIGMNNTCEVVINVVNIQDTPPAFPALQYNGRVKEEAQIGKVILAVTAIDGDTVSTLDHWEGAGPNQMYYSILNGDAGMFGINSSSGEIITVRELDIDRNPNVTNGLVIMTIMAEELNTSMQPQYGNSSSTVLVLIQIEDANDNRPQFSFQSFSGSIRADAAVGELLTIEGGGYISVSDIDQAPSNNHFSLHIEQNGQHWDIFKPTIESQYAYASVMIQLSNKSIKDLGDTHIYFQIVAQEYGCISQKFPPTKADMTVWVKAAAPTTSPPEPIINLPLSASDIIVFIVGIMLLLNIGLTIFICYVMKCGHRPVRIFSRNSKYYVSGTKKANKENNDNSYFVVQNVEQGKEDVPQLESSHQNNVATDTSLTNGQAQLNVTPAVNDITLTTPIDQSGVKLVEDIGTLSSLNVHIESGKGHTKSNEEQASDVVTASQKKSQDILINVLNGNSHSTEEVPLKMSASLDTSLTDNSHTHSNNSSFSEKNMNDGVPLIKFSPEKFTKTSKSPQTNQTSEGDLPFAMVKFRDVDKLKENNQNFTLLPAIKPDKDVSFEPSLDANTRKEFQPSSPNTSLSNSYSTTYPTSSLITQPGFPPVALALPYATGNLNINKEPYTGILNPVFETSANPDNKKKRSIYLKPVSDLNTPSSLPVSAEIKSFPPQMPSISKQDNASDKGKTDCAIESSLSFSGDSSFNSIGDSNKPYMLSQEGSNTDTTKQLKENKPVQPVTSNSSKPDSQNFIAAAKTLLSTAKNDMRPKEKPASDTASTEDANKM